MTLASLGTAALNFALLFVLFVPLERLFPARRQRLWRKDSTLDALFFLGQYLLFGALAVALLAEVQRGFENLGIAFRNTGRSAFAEIAIAALAVVTGDIVVYWFHRACHKFDFLWRFHAVHHSSEELDWLAAHREHPLDGMSTQLFQNLPALALGVRFELLAGLVVFRNAWAIFIHSNVSLPLGPLRFVLGAPELHRFHHARVRQTRHNFANLAPWLDVVFGTYYRPEPGRSFELGLPEASARGYLSLLVAPFAPRRSEPPALPMARNAGVPNG